MPKFVKKPVEIEARQLPNMRTDTRLVREIYEALAEWCGGNVIVSGSTGSINIPTLEGTMQANPGDWIIKGVKGEFYPCKPDIFNETYEWVKNNG